ncbi:10844_t:CDS:2 [Funneliformis mosseae]|uniref:10844_t:CDS:1 n=1 Tax=Funneliformis mosseae TaxID=27381 RepID=A0A9N9BH61_FUNMO|nr:10844_t:CDS:2 [Funneliformis mosseae]
MANPFRYIRDKVQEKKIEKLAKKSGTTLANLPPFLNNHNTATLVLRALKGYENMPALVFNWNPAGFNDIGTAPGLRNGVAGQNLAAIIANLTANGATNYNNVVFTFPNGNAIGVWINQISVNIPWAINQVGVPDVVTSVTRINRITERDTGTPSTAFDLEDYRKAFA